MDKRHGAAPDGAPLVVVCSAAAELSLFLRHLLESDGLIVEIAVTAKEAHDRIVGLKAAAALIDAQLEGALVLCRRLRTVLDETDLRIVVLFGEETHRTYPEFLAAGMNEGLVRPVEPGSILAAVGRRTWQSEAMAANLIRVLDVEIDIASRRVRRGATDIRLTRIEFELLVLLARAPMTVFSREALIAGAWPKGIYVDPRTVNIHIGRLRRRLMSNGGQDLIRTVRGSGYALDESGD